MAWNAAIYQKKKHEEMCNKGEEIDFYMASC